MLHDVVRACKKSVDMTVHCLLDGGMLKGSNYATRCEIYVINQILSLAP
jgi:hypothetical protein